MNLKMFWNKNERIVRQLSDDYLGLSKQVQLLASAIKLLETDVANLRGRLNTKLGGRRKTEDSEDTESLNSSVILPE